MQAKDANSNQTQNPLWLRNLEKLLRDGRAWPDFLELERKGCDRTRLFWILSVLHSPVISDESWTNLVGMDRRNFVSLPARIRKWATEIETLGGHALMARVTLVHESSNPHLFRLRQLTWDLPGLLREFASLLDSQKGHIGPKKPIMRDSAKLQLVSYVKAVTRKVHDREVSSLIKALLDRPDYDENAHKDWRQKHRKLLNSFRLPFYVDPLATAPKPQT